MPQFRWLLIASLFFAAGVSDADRTDANRTNYFLAQNLADPIWSPENETPAGTCQREWGMNRVVRIYCRLKVFDGTANVDQIIGNDAEPGPSVHSVITLIPAAVQSVPSFEYTDASFASGSPLLPLLEPASALLLLARHAFS